MRYYISGPMSGYPEYNMPVFDSVAAMLREDGHYAFSPADLCRANPDRDWTWYMSRCLHTIAKQPFDRLYVLEGWQASKGAVMEVCLGLALGIDIEQAQPSHWWPVGGPHCGADSWLSSGTTIPQNVSCVRCWALRRGIDEVS